LVLSVSGVSAETGNATNNRVAMVDARAKFFMIELLKNT
jgi:hypothetical protein